MPIIAAPANLPPENVVKIALCLEYPIDQSGGTEVLVSELIKGLGRRHQILLVSPDSRESLANSPVAGFVAEHIAWESTGVSVSRARGLAEQLAKAKVDLVHFHFGGNYAWSNRAFHKCPVVHFKQFGVPCLSTNHGAFSILEGYCWHVRPLWVKLALFLPAWLSKQYVLAHLRAEVAVSRHDYFALRRWYWPLRKKFRVIYHSRLQEPPPTVTGERRKVILCAGTIGPRKGQPYLVEAFCRIASKFQDWNLVLIGRPADDGMLQQIKRMIAEHQLENRVQLLGWRSDEELNEWLREAAIFAMPSVHEGLGLSLQEAQYFGCACVASAAGGVVDLIQDGDNGLLVPVGQVTPLANALERLMNDGALRQKFGVRGPQSVLEKGMTVPQMVQAYDRLYAEVLQKPGRK